MPPVPLALRRYVAERTEHRCGYCQTQQQLIGMPLEIEHIIPEAIGGESTEANLWLACPSCSRHKATTTHATDRVTGVNVPLFNPRFQLWSDHFRWTERGLYIRGLTPIGR